MLVFDQFFPGRFVGGDLHGAGTDDADRLEVLGTHHPAQPARRMRSAGHDICDAHQILTALADGGHLGVGSHDVHDVAGGAVDPVPPHPAGVPDLDDVVVDLEPDRFSRPSLDDDGVIPGILELGPPVSSHVPGTGQLIRMVRPERDNRGAPRKRRPGAGRADPRRK